MRDALFFTKLRVFLGNWRWRSHRRAAWVKARLRQLRRRVRRTALAAPCVPAQHSRLVPSSPFVLESLEPRLLLAADLTGVLQAPAAIDPAVPTNTASAVVQVQNLGNQNVNQSQIGIYASLDTLLDNSDLLLGTANTGQVGAGQTKNVTVNLTLPNILQPVTYTLLAKVDHANALAENSETNNVAIGGTVNGTWQFGAVPGRSGSTTLTLREADGTTVTFSLTGPGLGEVIKDGTNWDLKVTGTTASSAVTITTNSGGNGRVTLNDVHVVGPLAAFTAATTDLTGTMAIDGPVNISGILPGAITLRSVSGGTLAVPSVEALTILGSTTNATFLIGATLGQDGQPGGTGANTDTYGQGKIGLFTVTGAMTNTAVRVGIDPVDGTYGNGNDQLIGGTNSNIGGLIIGGTLSADTRFYAGRFPAQYLNGLTLKPTAGDFHFISNFSGPSLTAALQQDSGSSTSDRLTNNPAITGTVTDPQGIATFTAGFGATPTVNILSDRQADGSFTLTRARLEQINGGPLTDGLYTLKLLATDTVGNGTQITVSFTLDTQMSTLTLDLDPAFDSAPVGDQQTTNALVTLVGQTEANAAVELVELGLTTTADASGQFSFTNVALTLGANAFTVRATDPAGNQRTEARTITRLAVNQAPVLDLIGSQTVNEEVLLTFTAQATDPDAGQGLTFSLENGASGQVPAGASIDPTTGLFAWTPTEAQGPGTVTFDVVVTDNGSPSTLSDRETITVTVNEVNQAPTLEMIPNQTVTAGQLLTFTAVGHDNDAPANPLTYSLEGTVPSGASIDPTTGVFTWTPTAAQVGPHSLTVRVTDVGTTSLIAEQTITLQVSPIVTTIRWINPNGGFWNDPANWDLNRLPGLGDDVIINLPGTYEVFLSTGATIKSLTTDHPLKVIGLSVREAVQSTSRFEIVGGSVLLNGPATFQALELSGGTLTGSGAVTVNGRLTVGGGGIGGSGALDANGGIEIFGDGHTTFSGRTINIPIGQTATMFGSFRLDGFINNAGTFEVRVGDIIGGGRLSNTGTFRVNCGPSGQSTISSTFSNSGTVVVETGTLVLRNGLHTGSFVAESGTTLEFGGNITVSGTYDVISRTRISGGTVNFVGNVVSVGNTLEILGGTANFSSGELITPDSFILSGGTLTGSDVVSISGLTNWSSSSVSSMSGTGVTNANGGLVIGGIGAKTLNQRILNVPSGETATITTGFSLDNGAVLNNAGTIELQAGPGVEGGGTILNTGIFRKSGAGFSTVSATLNNSGVLDVRAGTLELDPPSTGFTNTATMRIGPSARLRILADFAQSSAGTLIVELGGLNSYGELDIVGSVDLGGRLTVELVNGFSPSSGNTFVVMTWTVPESISDLFFDLFDSVVLPSGFSHVKFSTSYSVTA